MYNILEMTLRVQQLKNCADSLPRHDDDDEQPALQFKLDELTAP
jgi:hypothetical protein